jgi:FkbM family methyltransferase
MKAAPHAAVNAVRRVGLYESAKRVERGLAALTRAGREDRARLRAAGAFYSEFVGSGDLCFDVGANHGTRVEVFRRLGARVIAVEPQHACVESLRGRFGGDRNVTIIDAGVSSSAGERNLLIASIDTLSTMSPSFAAATRASGRFESEQWSSSSPVRVTTLDDLISVFGIPAFTKIDVEGHEQEVLKGLSVPLPAVSFEVTAELLDEALGCIDALDALSRYEFAFSIGETFAFTWTRATADEAKREIVQLVPGADVGDLYAVSQSDVVDARDKN